MRQVLYSYQLDHERIALIDLATVGVVILLAAFVAYLILAAWSAVRQAPSPSPGTSAFRLSGQPTT